MRRAAPELGPLIRSGALALLLLLASARAALAQDETADPRASASAQLATTRLAGAWAAQAGGALTFRLGRRFEVGAVARVTLAPVEVARGDARVRLRFGYAGASVSALPAPDRWPGARVGLLLAGGNAGVRDPGISTLVDSDNGAVVEPSASYSRALLRGLSASGSLAWRYTTRFGPIGGLRSRDLRGPTAGIAVVFGPF